MSKGDLRDSRLALHILLGVSGVIALLVLLVIAKSRVTRCYEEPMSLAAKWKSCPRSVRNEELDILPGLKAEACRAPGQPNRPGVPALRAIGSN